MREIRRDDISFAGNSIGLALTMGILTKIEGFDIDAYTAFTGCVEWESGEVPADRALARQACSGTGH